MDYAIGETLADLRKAKKLTQKALAERLSDYGFEVNHRRIYDWEKEVSQPNIQQFIALCDILNVDDILWQFAGIHKGTLAGLNDAGRRKAQELYRELTDLLFHIDMYRDDPEDSDEDEPRLLKLYDIPVSAGTGNILDSNNYELIDVPSYVPDSADFALRVSGDSMEPLFQDSQIIWVKEALELDSGEIGVVEYYGEVFLKKLVIAGRKMYLRSLNPNYKDIKVQESLGFRVIGKVVA